MRFAPIPGVRLLAYAATVLAATPPPDLAVLADRNPSVVLAAPDGRALLQANRTLLVGVRAGELELWATRRPDGGVAVEQVLGAQRRPLAMRRASFTRGIRGLVRLVVRRPSGAVVTTTYVDACPNSPLAQPFDLANAPPLRRYPFDCGHVLSTAVVWGLERGWAVPLDLQLPQLEPGAYVFEASLAPGRLLHRNRAGDRLRVPVKVTRPIGARVPAATPSVEPRNARSAPSAAPSTRAARRAQRLPDLVPLAPEGFRVVHSVAGRDLLRFGSNVWNAGTAPAVVVGRRPTGVPGRTMPAYQVVNGLQRRAGNLVYDVRDGHLHWHFDGLARYRLLDAGGRPVLISDKVGFCFGSTDAIDLARPAARWNPPFATDGCASGRPAARSVRMALQVGWGDQYDQTLPGQSLDVTDLPNGPYGLEVAVDPRRRLVQSSRANDRVVRPIVLGGRPGARTVTVPAWKGVDTEAALREAPSAATATRTFACVLAG